MARRARRDRITAAFEEFHDALSAVLGAAARLRDGLAQRHAETMVEMWLRKEGLDAARTEKGLRRVLRNRRLAGAVSRVTWDRDAAFDEWLGPGSQRDSGPRRLAALMTEHAPHGAGDLDGWLGEVGKVEAIGPVPQLWRIGTGAVGPPRADGEGTFPVGVPLLDESHLQVSSTRETRAAAESLVEALLMRVVGYFRPGLVQLHVWDVGQFTGALPGLYPLTRTGLLTVHDPGNLQGLLDELSDRIRRVHTRVLIGGDPSLKALAARSGQRTEPWVVAVLVGDRSNLAEEDELQRVLRGGLACGISVVLLDVPMTIGAPLETVRLDQTEPVPPTPAATTATTSMTGPYVTVTPDVPLPRDAVTKACNAVADEHEEWRSRIATFHDLLPQDGRWGTGDSTEGLCAPVGFVDGVPREMLLADASPHALVGGPSGSGKTNLLLAMIASLAARYSPDELELYLLDFKEGVSFAQFGPRRDRTWLPHAKLIGVNINTDREFGLALLSHLSDVMRRRSEEAKRHEVTKLEELRAEDPHGRWPRIVAVIDEFQYLFAERDAVTRQAVQLLEDLARRGRSQGIHLVLASQDVSGIEALWLRPAIFEQFVLRIGLPRARRVLTERNNATLELARWHAVLNHESGVPHGNEVIRIPDASAKGTVDTVQAWAHRVYGHDHPEPRLFDGSRAPRVEALLGRWSPRTDSPRALVGQSIDVAGSAATVALPAVPGRNVGVLGADGDDPVRVLGAAVASLASEHPPETARFVLAPLIADAVAPAAALARYLRHQTAQTVRLDGFPAVVTELAAEVMARLSSGERSRIYLILYAGDAADAVLDRKQSDALRQLLRFGPENGVHTVGWWRSPARLRSLLTVSASPDDLGALVALDVQGSEFGALAPPGLLPSWSPRPGRALLFDRARHSRPEVVIVPAPGGDG